MTAKVVVVLLSLCVALATAKQAADTSLSLFSIVKQQTTATNNALAALPAACTEGTARSIQEAKIKVFGDVASCSVSGIIKNIAYIMIDSADFGSDVWSNGTIVIENIKTCWAKKNILVKVLCLNDALSDSDVAVEDINVAIKVLLEQLLVIIPDIQDEIKTCQGKSTQEYKQFLDGLVKKAKTC